MEAQLQELRQLAAGAENRRTVYEPTTPAAIASRELVIDAASSAPWFQGWTMPRTVRDGPRPTELPHTFLLARLWQKHGRIDPMETPGPQMD